MKIKTEPVQIILEDGKTIYGTLYLPENPNKLIVLLPENGSQKFHEFNKQLIEELIKKRYIVLQINLLTSQEQQIYTKNLDIKTLSKRLNHVINWLLDKYNQKDLDIIVVGEGLNSAAMIKSANTIKDKIKTVISVSGRPDFADGELNKLELPVLLIVGGRDINALETNLKAFNEIKSEKELEIIPGISHEFKEEERYQDIIKLIHDWITKDRKKEA